MPLLEQSMTTESIGTTFPTYFQWGKNERELIKLVKQQIQDHFPHSNNLLINTTWFGPQFNNDEYTKFLKLCKQQLFDQLFLLAGVDPVCLNQEQIDHCLKLSGAKHLYLLGNFDTKYQFNFISTVLPAYFKEYTQSQCEMVAIDHVFLNYNRKPHLHRIKLINLLEQQQLLQYGTVTLGNRYTLDEIPNQGNWGMSMDLGIPHDIHTLGDLTIWQRHFLNVVSETKFDPWDPMFITEKTFKPILGLRPFVINGQPKIYQYLRDQGFRTFNHHWPHIELEAVNELQVHDAIVQVIKYLVELGKEQLQAMYSQMLPDLLHNHKRFSDYANEQKNKINHLFKL
jgi:hypothetical protein